MSARTKKTTSKTSVSTPARVTQETPGRTNITMGQPGSGTRDPRAPSPTMVSRLQEKNELASLNDRLASYIDRVRTLESENGRLTRIIQTQEENTSRETVNIKGLYEQELASARRLLDDTSKEKAKLVFENTKLKAELDEVYEKLKQRERELEMAERKLMSAESQINDLQAKLNDAVNQRRHWEDEYNKVKKELDASLKNLTAAKKQLEDETIRRVDLENRLQSLKEELAFKKQVHEQELNESMHRSRIVVEETDDRYQQDYDNRLRDALWQMREENDEKIRATREDAEGTLEKKLAELREQVARSEGALERAQSELRTSRKRIDELTNEVTKLGSQNLGYEARVRDLENQLKREHDDHQASIASFTAEIRRLKATLEEQLQEYRDLMDVKIQLDTEIAAYRKLLESEETRLNLPSASPGRTPGESSRKRKRNDIESSFSGLGTSLGGTRTLVKDFASNSDYVNKTKAVDVVEVFEVSPDGKFIKLFNSSQDKDVSLGGWQLKHVCGDNETTYKFHRTTNLKAQHYVTVWSSDSEQTHAPPTDFVMKGQAWYAGDVMKTTLLDGQGEEQAACEMSRSQLRTNATYMRSSAADLDTTDGGLNESRKSTSKWGWSLFGAAN